MWLTSVDKTAIININHVEAICVHEIKEDELRHIVVVAYISNETFYRVKECESYQEAIEYLEDIKLHNKESK